eukprot:g4007.t1
MAFLRGHHRTLTPISFLSDNYAKGKITKAELSALIRGDQRHKVETLLVDYEEIVLREQPSALTEPTDLQSETKRSKLYLRDLIIEISKKALGKKKLSSKILHLVDSLLSLYLENFDPTVSWRQNIDDTLKPSLLDFVEDLLTQNIAGTKPARRRTKTLANVKPLLRQSEAKDQKKKNNQGDTDIENERTSTRNQRKQDSSPTNRKKKVSSFIAVTAASDGVDEPQSRQELVKTSAVSVVQGKSGRSDKQLVSPTFSAPHHRHYQQQQFTSPPLQLSPEMLKGYIGSSPTASRTGQPSSQQSGGHKRFSAYQAGVDNFCGMCGTPRKQKPNRFCTYCGKQFDDQEPQVMLISTQMVPQSNLLNELQPVGMLDHERRSSIQDIQVMSDSEKTPDQSNLRNSVESKKTETKVEQKSEKNQNDNIMNTQALTTQILKSEANLLDLLTRAKTMNGRIQNCEKGLDALVVGKDGVLNIGKHSRNTCISMSYRQKEIIHQWKTKHRKILKQEMESLLDRYTNEFKGKNERRRSEKKNFKIATLHSGNFLQRMTLYLFATTVLFYAIWFM